MSKQSKAWWLVGSVALVVAGCGGGSGSSSNSNGNDGGSGGTTPGTGGGTTTPSQPNLAERIEPYDTVVAKSAAVSAQPENTVRGLASEAGIARVSLASPAAALKRSTLAAAVDAPPGTPMQIGVGRDVAATASVPATSALLKWKSLSDGSRVAAIEFESPSAQGVRLGVLVQKLPRDAVLRFYGTPGGDAVQMSAAELQAQADQLLRSGSDETEARTYWSPSFGSSATILEVEIGANADASQVQIAVPHLSHNVYSADQLQQAVAEKASSGSCNIDVMCQPDYLNQGRAVASMEYVSDRKGYYCTGTLINDAKSSGTPYFLTANHCISTQAAASTLVTAWFYTSTACNSGTSSSGVRQLTKGATLLYATASTDTSFLQLNEKPQQEWCTRAAILATRFPAARALRESTTPTVTCRSSASARSRGLGIARMEYAPMPPIPRLVSIP
ncbi:trypsin-like serine peptidase [Diaphorobacter aerolatus]|uniref:endoproteinase ArgC n=1 Tax=Diaphorobacter aerolatus TaxID=1288495 RepID=UPI001D02F5BB|nr:endoproteinase ArgC [Diaphorobacter aerolatus]